jgi:hypothetical protein
MAGTLKQPDILYKSVNVADENSHTVIATHIKDQFEEFLSRISKDKLTLEENINMILKLPIVKEILMTKKKLTKQIKDLQEENKNLKLKMIGKDIFCAMMNTESSEIRGIVLEVNELPGDDSDNVTQEDIKEHIKEREKKNLIKSKMEMVRKYTQLSKSMDDEETFSYNLLQNYQYGDEDDDEDDDDDDNGDEDDDDDDDDDNDDDDEDDENEDEDEDDDEDEDEDEEDEDDKEEDDDDGEEKEEDKNKKKSAEEERDELESEEEEDVEEIELNGKKYYTTNKDSGDVYEYLQDGEIGKRIGCNLKSFFYPNII